MAKNNCAGCKWLDEFPKIPRGQTISEVREAIKEVL